MKRVKGIIGLLLVFAVGIGIGWIATSRYYHKKVDSMLKGAPEAFQDVIVRRMDKKLGLDKAQEAQIREILRETHEQMAEAREEFDPEIQEILQSAKGRVKSVLKPAQVGKFEKMTASPTRLVDGQTPPPAPEPATDPIGDKQGATPGS
ncbi:MAG: hypothetical protein HZA04_07905 [Nitrospinae bacterium]|nr:hypothetical protein [Nitrospinota bacterium]